jgi:polysaccharide biosynthesis protein PslG
LTASGIRQRDAAQYVQLLSETYKAVKAIDPNIIIVTGALSPTGTSNPPKWYDDFVYTDQLIKAGMLQHADCVGAHHNGYNIGPRVTFQDAPKDPKRTRAVFRGPFDNPNHLWSFNSTLSGYASRIKAAGSNLKLCVTEFGWPSMDDIQVDGKKAPAPRGFEFANDNTLAEQADYTNEAIDVMTEWGFVRLAFVWNLNYGAQIGWDPKNDNVPYSILGSGFQPRPVWQKIVDRNFRGKAR